MAYFIGAYWNARGESARECATRMATFFDKLTREVPGLSRWFKKTSNRKDALIAFPADSDVLESFFKTNKRDIGGDAIQELGFSFSAWTGPNAEAPASLITTCGASSSAIRNTLLISFSPEFSPSNEVLEAVFNIVISSFDPEDGIVNTTERLSEHSPKPASLAPALLRYKKGLGFSKD